MALKILLNTILLILCIVVIFGHPLSEKTENNNIEKYMELDKQHSNISPRKTRQSPGGGFGGIFPGFGGFIPGFLGGVLGGANGLGGGGLGGSGLGGGVLGGLLPGIGGGGLGGGGAGGLGGAGGNPANGFGQLFNVFGQNFGNAFAMGLQGFFGGFARPAFGGQSLNSPGINAQGSGTTSTSGNIPISAPTAILPDPVNEPILSSGIPYYNRPGFNNYNRGGPYNYYNRGPYNYGTFG